MHFKHLHAMLEDLEKAGLGGNSKCVEVVKDEQNCDKGIKGPF